MYGKYKSIHRDVPKFLECSECFGHPLFASEKSFLMHQQECHFGAFKMSTSVTDNNILSNKQHQSIETLVKNIASNKGSIYESEIQDQLLNLIAVMKTQRGDGDNPEKDWKQIKELCLLKIQQQQNKRPSFDTICNVKSSETSLEELSFKAKKLKSVNKIWMGGADRNQKEIYQQKLKANHIQHLLNDKTTSPSEKSALEMKGLALAKDLEEKERLLIISQSNIKTCREVAEITEKQLLKGCIEKLKKKYNVEKQLKERKTMDFSTKLFDIEKYYGNVNETIAKLEKDKYEILAELEDKESFFQEERQHQAGRMKEYVAEVEKLREERLKFDTEKKEAIEQVKTEIENKANERFTHYKANERFTHHKEELAIANNKLNAKDKHLRKHLRKAFNQCYALNKELSKMKAEFERKALELVDKETFFQEDREHQAGRMKEYVTEVEKLKVTIQEERTDRKEATEKLQAVEEKNRKIMKENEELRMKLQTFMKNSNDVKEIPMDNSSVLSNIISFKDDDQQITPRTVECLNYVDDENLLSIDSVHRLSDIKTTLVPQIVNDVIILEPIACKVTTVPHFSSSDYDKLAEPDVPNINTDNIKLAELVVRFTNTNTNQLVKSANKACSMNSVTEGCYSLDHFDTITTTDDLNNTNNNSTSVHLINNDSWVVVAINNNGWDVDVKASNEVAEEQHTSDNFEEENSDSQTTSYDNDSAGLNLPSYYINSLYNC